MRTGNFVIFEVDALMYAVLCALWGISWYQ
jgi:hypothetical protein